jgi:hypothetical protein
MADSQLNGAEQALQHSFMKSFVFSGLIMATAIGLVVLLIRAMPDRHANPSVLLALTYRPVELAPVDGPLRLVGAWEVNAPDRRLGGLSALTTKGGKFIALSDRGVVVTFDRPGSSAPMMRLSDLREGPGPFGKKWARDAESIARDPRGRGWWIGFEQRHSIWLYDTQFQRALASVDLKPANWSDNRGPEGLTVSDGKLLVLGENGRDAILLGPAGPQPLKLHANAQVADAAKAPDGSIWVLLRRPGLSGLAQSVAPLRKSYDGWTVGPESMLPKGPLDNFEGMLIEQRSDSGWRIWLVSDNDYRSMARTLLVALDVKRSPDTTKARRQAPGFPK